MIKDEVIQAQYRLDLKRRIKQHLVGIYGEKDAIKAYNDLEIRNMNRKQLVELNFLVFLAVKNKGK